jgi:hypothetical protein
MQPSQTGAIPRCRLQREWSVRRGLRGSYWAAASFLKRIGTRTEVLLLRWRRRFRLKAHSLLGMVVREVEVCSSLAYLSTEAMKDVAACKSPCVVAATRVQVQGVLVGQLLCGGFTFYGVGLPVRRSRTQWVWWGRINFRAGFLLVVLVVTSSNSTSSTSSTTSLFNK